MSSPGSNIILSGAESSTSCPAREPGSLVGGAIEPVFAVSPRGHRDYGSGVVSWNRSFSALFTLVLLGVGLPRVAWAEADRDRAAARSAADAGGDAFDQGRYGEALELFSRAEQLVHAPPHLLFMARSDEKLGKLVDARENYLKIVKEKLPANAPAAFKRAQSDAEAEVSAVEARLAYVTVSVKGQDTAGALLSMDGGDLPPAMVGIPFPVDPGAHVFAAHTKTVKSSEVRVSFREGAKESVVLTLTEPIPASEQAPEVASPSQSPPTLQPQPADRSSLGAGKIVGIVSLGAGLAATGVGTYFLISSVSSRNKASDLFACDATAAGCSTTQKNQINSYDADADRARNFAIASYAVAAVGVVTGVVLLATSPSGRSSARLEPAKGLIRDFRIDAGLNWLGASGRF